MARQPDPMPEKGRKRKPWSRSAVSGSRCKLRVRARTTAQASWLQSQQPSRSCSPGMGFQCLRGPGNEAHPWSRPRANSRGQAACVAACHFGFLTRQQNIPVATTALKAASLHRPNLRPGLSNMFLPKGQTASILGFSGHMSSVATAQLRHGGRSE